MSAEEEIGLKINIIIICIKKRVEKGRSVRPLTKIRKRRGRRMEPCVTPKDTNRDEEEEPFTTTHWVWLRR